MSDGRDMTPRTRSPLVHLAVLAGVTLVIAGVLLAIAQIAGSAAVLRWWPVLIVFPALLALVAALAADPASSVPYLAVPAAFVLVGGLVLLAQSLTGDWQSWSYAWPLLAPGSLGLGLLLAGWRKRARSSVTGGATLLVTGLALFVVAEWFFVRVLGVGGPGLGWPFGLAMPVLVVVFGAWLVVRGLRHGR